MTCTRHWATPYEAEKSPPDLAGDSRSFQWPIERRLKAVEVCRDAPCRGHCRWGADAQYHVDHWRSRPADDASGEPLKRLDQLSNAGHAPGIRRDLDLWSDKPELREEPRRLVGGEHERGNSFRSIGL